MLPPRRPVLKQIRGGSFQCWDGLTAAAQKFLPNIKERLFCKRPHHAVLKTDIALLAPVGLVVLSTARTDVGLDNIEEGGGRIVSEVGERYFCKHRYACYRVLLRAQVQNPMSFICPSCRRDMVPDLLNLFQARQEPFFPETREAEGSAGLELCSVA